MSSVLHVFKSSVVWLSNVASRSPSTAIVIRGLGNRLRVTHLQFTSVHVLFTILECIWRYTEEYRVDFTLLHSSCLEVSDLCYDLTVCILFGLSRDEHVGLSESQGRGQGELTELSGDSTKQHVS